MYIEAYAYIAGSVYIFLLPYILLLPYIAGSIYNGCSLYILPVLIYNVCSLYILPLPCILPHVYTRIHEHSRQKLPPIAGLSSILCETFHE